MVGARIVAVCIASWCSLATGLVARASGEGEPIVEDTEEAEEESIPATAWPKLSYEGELSLGGSLNYAQSRPPRGQADYRGLSRLRMELELGVDARFSDSVRARASGHGFRDFAYRIKNRREFTHQVLDLYEAEVELDELWLEASPISSLDVKIGRQVAAFGPADMLRVVDVLNPIDNREPGLVDLEQLRLPVAMTRLDYFLGPTRTTLIAVHESRFDKQPVFGSDFFPENVPRLGEDRPANGGGDTEYSAVVAGTFADTDLGLYHTRYFERRPRLGRDGLLKHDRLTLTGASMARAVGEWLLKGEFAYVRGLEFVQVSEPLSRSDLLVGAEYAGVPNAQISLEIATRRLNGFASVLESGPDPVERTSYQTSLRWMQSFREDTLRATVLVMLFGAHAEDGGGMRASLIYLPRDGFSFELGVLGFRSGDRPPFTFIGNNDRIFFKASYGL